MTFTYFGGPLDGETVSGLDQACVEVFYSGYGGTYVRERATRRYVWRTGRAVEA